MSEARRNAPIVNLDDTRYGIRGYRRIIYTTNAIKSLHSGARKSIRNKGHFPNDEAATKLIWLALRNITAKWKNPPITWAKAKAQFAIQFGERFSLDD